VKKKETFYNNQSGFTKKIGCEKERNILQQPKWLYKKIGCKKKHFTPNKVDSQKKEGVKRKKNFQPSKNVLEYYN